MDGYKQRESRGRAERGRETEDEGGGEGEREGARGQRKKRRRLGWGKGARAAGHGEFTRGCKFGPQHTYEQGSSLLALQGPAKCPAQFTPPVALYRSCQALHSAGSSPADFPVHAVRGAIFNADAASAAHWWKRRASSRRRRRRRWKRKEKRCVVKGLSSGVGPCFI